MAYPDEVEVTEGWFTPHMAIREDSALEMSMFCAWRKYMSQEGEGSSGWSTRLAEELSYIPGALNVRGGRVAATFIVWLARNNGQVFLAQLFKDQKREETFLSRGRLAVQSWAAENQLSSRVGNPLNQMLLGGDGKPIYPESPRPTLEDHRVIEMVCIILVSDEGKKFLRRVYTNAARRKDAGKIPPLPF